MRRRTQRMVQWRTTSLLALVCAAAVGSSACDDLTAGQPADSTSPPRLVRVTVQDVRGLEGTPSPVTGFAQRDSVVDLLDTGPLQACSDIEPCVGQFTIDLSEPDFSCNAGFCNDPLRVPVTGVPLSVPLTGFHGDAGSGMQIRIVFDKLFDDSMLETITVDPTQPQGSTLTYVLDNGLAELDDAKGVEVDSLKIYDNGGASSFTSDLMLAPFGPAIVIKPKQPLAPATTYTVKLTQPQKLVDKEGNAAVGPDGNALGATYTISFTTEALTQNAAASFPDFTQSPTTITPNELLQFAFWEPIDETTATATVTGPGGAVVAVQAYADRGGDATMCAANPWVVDVVDAPGGTPSDWPPGDYTLSLTVKDATGVSSAATGKLQFTVGGTAAAMDPEDWRAHVTPAQCTN